MTKVKESVLKKLGYSDKEWEKQRQLEMSKPLKSKKEELARDIFLFLERSNRLESINLNKILQDITEQKQTGGEYQVRLENLIRLDKPGVFHALKQLKIDVPLPSPEKIKTTQKEPSQQSINPINTKNEGLNTESPLDVDSQVTVPLGYRVWSLSEIENYENRTVSYWTTQGEYGNGKFFTHPKKLHEYCFQPADGHLVVFTEAHRKRLTAEGAKFRFKALD
jgi:hypothetical protein